MVVHLVLFCAAPLLTAKSSSSSQKQSRYYTVKKGDTLFSLSRKYSIDVDELCRLNNISGKKPLYVGKRLVIKRAQNSAAARPVKSSAPVKSTAKASPPAKSISTKNLHFNWPVKSITGVERDGADGVKSIGIIIRTAPGTAVYSAENGVVQKIGYMRGFGNYVVMKHDERFMTVYANLDSVAVKDGQSVGRGVPIGRIAKNDSSIHFQINHAGRALDALTILPPRG